MAARGLGGVVNIDDLRTLAQRRLPRVVFDYVDGGAEAEITMRANVQAFEGVRFRPRSAVANAPCNLRTTLLGRSFELPFLLAPLGSSRMLYPRGECAAARAAGKAGTGYILSTLSGCPLEDVKASTLGRAWYQLYLVGGRSVATAAIARARAAGFEALVVTIDTPVAGMRERDVRNGAKQLSSGKPLAILPYAGQLLARPRWVFDFLRDGGMMRFPNVVLDNGPMAYEDAGSALGESSVSWNDFEWIKAEWNGPVVVKGVQSREDAERAVERGADAIVVSNHGGRQLDGVPATLHILPDVIDAAGDRVEVLIDGGIRRGSDVVKALCLGARGVLIGRAYAYGLAAAGEAGVTKAIDILRADIVRTLNLLGCHDIAALDRSFLVTP
ncbi:MAG: alpha-hydroxy-acid oxidizing protein [Candidatus Eremiobacteraeota bacterium]|nr:alpha-hydroxy-acid oxidizing protein [Candidatus Eremiobacteraeota bacterium]